MGQFGIKLINTTMRNLFILLLTTITLNIYSQNVAITDDDTYSAHTSAMLDVKSITKGLLVPRLTTVQRNSISSPANGLLVFDTTLGGFYYYNGTSWSNLTSGITSNLWSFDGTNKVYLTNVNNRLGVGTNSPNSKMVVKGDATLSAGQALFSVVNKDNDTIFAVYDGGVRVYVYDDPLVKAPGSKGGFAVGGFSPNKGLVTNEYLRITPDSVRIYIEEESLIKAGGSKGGFAVGGFSPNKATPSDYFNIYGDNSPTNINPSDARIFWYPLKEALLSGRVLVESPDSVGTNSFSSGFESKAIGDYSQALGYHARAFGDYSTAIGNNAEARANNSFAFGDFATASGNGSYAFGSVGRDISGNSTGNPTLASGNYSVAMGMGSTANGVSSFSLGTNSIASGNYSTAFGFENVSSGAYSVTFGKGSTASNSYSFAAGVGATASGYNSYSFGLNSNSSGSYSYAFGNAAEATSNYSLAMGYQAKANNNDAIALGRLATASGQEGVAIGYSSNASWSGVAIGRNSVAAMWSLAMGIGAEANAIGSTALGWGSIANGGYSKAMGPIEASGLYTFAIALSDQSTTNVSQANTLSIMGGEVGIGTISPSSNLHVVANESANFAARFWNDGNNSDRYGVRIQAGTDNGAGINYMIRFYDGDGTYEGAIVNNAGTLSLIQNSDLRLKKDITSTTYNALNIINNLRIVDFKYLDSDVKHTGYIAQEVLDVFPEMVVNDPETDRYGVSYDKLIPVLNKAIQEQQQMINELKEQNVLLKQRIETLENN